MVATGMDNGTLWRSALRCFFGEMGDMTFFITVLLTVWCPLRGVRSGRQVNIQHLFVWLGSVCALGIRSVLVAVGPGDVWQSGFNFITAGMMIILGFKAKHELAQVYAQKGIPSKPEVPPQGNAETRTPPGSTNWNPIANTFLLPATWNPLYHDSEKDAAAAPEEPGVTVGSPGGNGGGPQQAVQGYGSIVPPQAQRPVALVPTARKPEDSEEEPGGIILTLSLSLGIPLVMIFLGEAGDKSQGALIGCEVQGAEFVLVGMLGYAVAALIAVVTGFVLERALYDEQLLFSVEIGLFVMSFVCITEGLLGLGALAARDGVMVAGSSTGAGGVPNPAAASMMKAAPGQV